MCSHRFKRNIHTGRAKFALYNRGSMTHIQDGTLGKQVSHGCVRLDINNAKWLYDNIPNGTKVVIY